MKAWIVSGPLLAALVQQVHAHGYVESGAIDGHWYSGFAEAEKPGNSAILVTDYLEPLYDVWDSRIACGTNAQAAQDIAVASPGSTVEWKWVTHTWVDGGKTWTHLEGTERLFVGKCLGSCSSTNPNDVEWAEITSARRAYDPNSRSWAATDLHNGNTWRETLPALPNGDYLLRSELTALHYSIQPMNPMDGSVGHGWGTEFYPTCMAMRMTNSDGSWNPGTVFKFPGAYNVNENFHYNPNFWTMDFSTFGFADTQGQYTVSGGVGKSTTGNGNGNGNGNNAPAATSTTNAPPAVVSNPLCKTRRKRSTMRKRGQQPHVRKSGHHL